jgi:hypothetical protein
VSRSASSHRGTGRCLFFSDAGKNDKSFLLLLWVAIGVRDLDWRDWSGGLGRGLAALVGHRLIQLGHDLEDAGRVRMLEGLVLLRREFDERIAVGNVARSRLVFADEFDCSLIDFDLARKSMKWPVPPVRGSSPKTISFNCTSGSVSTLPVTEVTGRH